MSWKFQEANFKRLTFKHNLLVPSVVYNTVCRTVVGLETWELDTIFDMLTQRQIPSHISVAGYIADHMLEICNMTQENKAPSRMTPREDADLTPFRKCSHEETASSKQKQ
jgi:hypothetical protein